MPCEHSRLCSASAAAATGGADQAHLRLCARCARMTASKGVGLSVPQQRFRHARRRVGGWGTDEIGQLCGDVFRQVEQVPANHATVEYY